MVYRARIYSNYEKQIILNTYHAIVWKPSLLYYTITKAEPY